MSNDRIHPAFRAALDQIAPPPKDPLRALRTGGLDGGPDVAEALANLDAELRDERAKREAAEGRESHWEAEEQKRAEECARLTHRECVLAAALARCIQETPPQHIPGDVYAQAQRALLLATCLPKRD